MMARMVVVLPAPLRPSSVTTSPAFTSKVMPCRTWLSPYQPCRSRTASCASAMAASRPCPCRLRSPAGSSTPPRRALGQHLAARQHRDAVGQVGDHRQVVLHHQHRAVLGDAPDQRRRALDVLARPCRPSARRAAASPDRARAWWRSPARACGRRAARRPAARRRPSRPRRRAAPSRGRSALRPSAPSARNDRTCRATAAAPRARSRARVRCGNTAEIWKERTSPRRATACGWARVMSRPL